ncbi:hypothetical protein F5Y06DRAFT_20602 [Hypoxylon sp. FL0890]|nr:hypothetical protein F5Y06DRAFT_20602 [Hypoxylon sp. FL0890]
MHGKDPSRGANKHRDAGGFSEEEKADMRANAGFEGKQEGGHTYKSEARQEVDQEAYEGRKAHSKSGANTGKHVGMEYVPRKNHSSRE